MICIGYSTSVPCCLVILPCGSQRGKCRFQTHGGLIFALKRAENKASWVQERKKLSPDPQYEEMEGLGREKYAVVPIGRFGQSLISSI